MDVAGQFQKRSAQLRIIIIVTTPDPAYVLWAQAEQWTAFELPQGVVVRVESIGSDIVLMICQADSNLQSADRSKDINSKTTDRVIQIVSSKQYNAAREVYIASHSDYVDFKRVGDALATDRFGGYASFSHYPSSPGLDPLFDELSRLTLNPGSEEFEHVLEAIKKKQKLTHAQRLSKLKHRLAHVFLPISVDLQAWKSFGFDDEYMKEMLAFYAGDEGRLERARELLYHEETAIEGDSVKKILREAGLDESASESWHEIQRLLPEKEPEAGKEKTEAPEYTDLFKTQDMLGCLKNREKLKQLRTVLRTGNPFNDWFAKLEKALIKLRDEIESLGND